MGLIQPAILHMWQEYSWQALNSLPHSGHNLLIQQIKPANIFQAFFIYLIWVCSDCMLCQPCH